MRPWVVAALALILSAQAACEPGPPEWVWTRPWPDCKLRPGTAAVEGSEEAPVVLRHVDGSPWQPVALRAPGLPEGVKHTFGPVDLSPDRRWLAFFAYWAENLLEPRAKLYAVSCDGQEVRELGPNRHLVNALPHVAPDGRRVAYVFATESNGGLAVIDIEQGTEDVIVQLADGTLPASRGIACPSWSPDGTRIAYHVDAVQADREGLYIVDVATRDRLHVQRDVGSYCSGIAWSTGGSTVYFGDHTKTFQIRMYGLWSPSLTGGWSPAVSAEGQLYLVGLGGQVLRYEPDLADDPANSFPYTEVWPGWPVSRIAF